MTTRVNIVQEEVKANALEGGREARTHRSWRRKKTLFV